MNHAGQIRDVSDTALWVAHYRAVESERPDAMFRDPLAGVLVGKRGAAIASRFGRAGQFTAWAVVCRTVIIDQYILEALREGVDAVVNLGAGLDTRPYRMDLPAALHWVEADFPHMVGYKEETLRDQAPRCRLERVGVDLANDAARRAFIAQVAPEARRILVITEGVVPYLTEEQVTALAQDLRDRRDVALWIGEYFSELSYPYLQRMTRSAQMANSPFRFFPARWIEFFHERGWQQRALHHYAEVGQRFHRAPPFPWLVRLMIRLMSRERRERIQRTSGYLLLERRAG
jgi:methyltransferase (TIGR00027 family)